MKRIPIFLFGLFASALLLAGNIYAVRVVWDPNPERDVSTYRVRWSSAGGTNTWTALVTTNSIDLSLPGPGPWSVNVSAINSAGMEGPTSTNLVFAFPSIPGSLRVVAGFVTQSTNWVLTP